MTVKPTISYQVGMDALRLKPAARLAHTEYCSHAALIKRVTGRENNGMTPEFCRAWELDFIWSVDDGPVPGARADG